MTKVLSPRINYHIGNKFIIALACYVYFVCNESKDLCEFADVAYRVYLDVSFVQTFQKVVHQTEIMSCHQNSRIIKYLIKLMALNGGHITVASTLKYYISKWSL